jgi:hypothetical protein
MVELVELELVLPVKALVVAAVKLAKAVAGLVAAVVLLVEQADMEQALVVMWVVPAQVAIPVVAVERMQVDQMPVQVSEARPVLLVQRLEQLLEVLVQAQAARPVLLVQRLELPQLV